MRPSTTIIIMALSFIITPIVTPGFAASVKDSLKVVKSINQESINSQKHVDKLSLETKAMLEEYRQILRHTDFQDTYNQELKQLAQTQETQIEELNQQIEQVKITQMRIMPLMLSMSEALKKFVILDLPFHEQERSASVVLLSKKIRDPSLSIPDKLRLLLEAFQIENTYGHTVEAYRSNVIEASLDDSKPDVEPVAKQISVDILRIGRVALYYQTLDGMQSAFWSITDQKWAPLPKDQNHQLTTALRIAKKQRAPQLFTLPIFSPEQ